MKLKTEPHPVDSYVGKKLRMRRTILDISQAALADQVGISAQQVQKYESALNRISVSKLWDFSKALDTNTEYFFRGYQDD
ncbi:helix-turn-helix domain-containing protein [Kiloniella majae]|uniref:helix-turn-helix domain-containing protein n=1 Tax=Kiloniella majae TaxID=1938558 RepID=UPI000A278B40|nr:helix-turn-helix transcriptional regulator [Kiloniella majae]